MKDHADAERMGGLGDENASKVLSQGVPAYTLACISIGKRLSAPKFRNTHNTVLSTSHTAAAAAHSPRHLADIVRELGFRNICLVPTEDHSVFEGHCTAAAVTDPLRQWPLSP